MAAVACSPMARERLGGRITEAEGAAAMPDAIPPPVHLDKVVDGLAGNPALPSELVRRLLGYRKGFGTVAERPDLSDDMIAEIIAADDHWLTHSLALNRSLPHAFRMMLAEHPDPAVRTAVAVAAGDAPRELYERLLGDADPQVRGHVAESDHVPADLRARLAADSDPKVRATLAQWWTTAPEEVRRLLLTDPDDSVRAGACATYFRRIPHPVPPADLVPALLADPVTRAGAVRHCTLDTATARRLADDPDDEVREELAEHPDLPPALRDKLAQDTNLRVALRVFARQDTPEPTRAAIHAQILSDVPPLEWLASHQALDDNTLERELMGEIARAELRALRLPWVTADPLPYVDSPYACFRASAAMSDRLPAPLVTSPNPRSRPLRLDAVIAARRRRGRKATLTLRTVQAVRDHLYEELSKQAIPLLHQRQAFCLVRSPRHEAGSALPIRGGVVRTRRGRGGGHDGGRRRG
ncbi:hypothetical protein [Streptomyces sp. NPDC000410]|uniref:hypothetical protein n=1 Tax=Streptomyces sp. NPDC000410 TaxID=3154254 RepID=UPI00333442EC